MILAHTADQHLAATGAALDPETGLNARLIDRYRCTRFVVEDSVKRGAQLILSAGDLFNSPKPNPTERRLAIEALQPAINAGVPIVLLLGNHEMSRSPLDKHALDTMREVEGVTVVDRPCLLNVWEHRCFEDGHFSGDYFYSVEPLDMSPADGGDLVLQIACIPFPNASLLLRDEEARKLEPGERNLLIREKMIDVARGLAAQRIEGVPCVLLGHFSVDVASANDRLMMLGGDFTLNLQELATLSFDSVCLGHIHRRQVLSEEPWIGYCGSPECCSMGEESDGDKGYYLHEIGDNDAWERAARRHHASA